MKLYSGYHYRGTANYYRKPFYKTRGFLILLLFVLAGMGFVYFSIKQPALQDYNGQKLTDQTLAPINAAKISFATGKVELKSPNDDWQEVAENYQAQADDVIRTASASRVIVELPDKSIIRLAPQTEIKLVTLGLADVIIEQLAGTTFHRVSNDSPAIYRLKNRQTELTAIGTAFNVLVSDQLTYLTVTESKVKVKIYNANNDTVNLRTIEEGSRAIINPTLPLEQMIKVEEIKSIDLIADDWFNWNLDKDREQNFYLGIFEQLTKLIIIEPKEAALTTDQDKIIIKGETDPAAKIYLAGHEIENNNGKFEINASLIPGKNELEIIVQKEKNINKKKLIINSTKQQESITLTGTISEQNSASLTWVTKNIQEFKEFKLLQSNSPDPTYPDAPYHTIAKTKFTDVWNNLNNGTNYFRVCVLSNENKCALYSNTITLTLGGNATKSENINLTTKVQTDNVALNWTVGTNLNPAEGFKAVISTNENPVYPGNSYHTLNSNERNDLWKKLGPGTYHFRICLLKNNQCVSYSNNATGIITDTTDNGTITLAGSAGDKQINLYWDVEGLKISKGFKVVMDDAPNVTFPGKDHHWLTASTASADTWVNLQTGKTYYFRVCQNLGSSCGIYSNEVAITFK